MAIRRRLAHINLADVMWDTHTAERWVMGAVMGARGLGVTSKLPPQYIFLFSLTQPPFYFTSNNFILRLPYGVSNFTCCEPKFCSLKLLAEVSQPGSSPVWCPVLHGWAPSRLCAPESDKQDGWMDWPHPWTFLTYCPLPASWPGSSEDWKLIKTQKIRYISYTHYLYSRGFQQDEFVLLCRTHLMHAGFHSAGQKIDY